MHHRGLDEMAGVDAGGTCVESSFPGLLWTTDTSLRVLTCQGWIYGEIQAAHCVMLGRTLGELLGTDSPEFPPIAAHRRALRGESTPLVMTLAGLTLAGEVGPVRSGSAITGCAGLALDQTTLRARWEAIARTAVDFILFLRSDGTIVEVNRTGGGRSREQVIGKTIFDFTPAESHFQLRTALASVTETGTPATLEVRFLGQAAQPRWHSMRIGPVRDGKGTKELVLLVTDITERQEAMQRLLAEEGLLRDLLELQDRERRMVAYEIHDGFIQDVVGSRMILQGIRAALLRCDDSLQQRLDSSISLLARAINDGRRLISELRPMIIDEMGIIDAMEYLIGEEESIGEFEIDFTHRLDTDRFPPLLQATIVRIVRESLSNARRHSGATRVEIRMTQIAGQFLILEIQDNGRGFDPDAVPQDRYGLAGIRERARLFGGGATIESDPDSGTRITVKLAMDANTDSQDNQRPKWAWTI